MKAAAAALVLLAACQQDIDQIDGVFYDGDGRLVHCAVNLDTSARTSDDSIDGGLDRARDRGEIVELYAHDPGNGVSTARIERVLAGAKARGLAFVTYADFAAGTEAYPGLALSFDDTFVDDWSALRPTFDTYGAHVTFFVSHYDHLSDEAHAKLQQLAADGHAVEAHTIHHLRAPDYVEDHGLDAYLHDEADPSIALMRADGFDVEAFAYPFGSRTGELDRAIAKRVPVIRSVAFTFPEVFSPCPD